MSFLPEAFLKFEKILHILENYANFTRITIENCHDKDGKGMDEKRTKFSSEDWKFHI